MIAPLHVVVRFGDAIPESAQASALLHLEQELRQLTGLDCRVFKDKMGDDSKLRRRMTEDERGRL